MGNSPSNSEAEEEIREESAIETDENDNEGEKESSLLHLTELLFDLSALRNMACKLDEDLPQDVISQHQTYILRWIDERMSRRDTTITMREFCEMLIHKGVSEKDAAKAFQLFDTDGIGAAELQDIEREVGSTSLQTKCAFTEPERSIRKLKSTTLIRDVVHIFSEEPVKGSSSSKILKFLVQNRAPSTSLSLSIMKGVTNVMDLRMALVKSSFKSMDNFVAEESLGNGEEIQMVVKCIHSVEVSTNRLDTYRLTNGNSSSYWQSDGTCRSHWIRLRIKNNVVIKQLIINVSSLDQSYMPQIVSVSVGKSVSTLKEIKEVRIPNHVNGEYTLVENLKSYFPLIQINIKRCHSDGCDTRVHGVKALGYRIKPKDPGLSVSDASAVWFMQIMSTWITSVLPSNELMKQNVLMKTRNALENMQPLCLSQVSNERPQFLSRHVLKEIDKFLSDVLFDAEGKIVKDDLDILLSFNLARGSMKGLVKTIKMFQDFPDLSMPCSQLMIKMIKSRNLAWEKQANSLVLPLCGCDGGQMDEKSAPNNVLGNHWNLQVYFTEEGKTQVNMFFEAPDYVRLTKLRIKVVSGDRGARRGLVFVYRDEEKFNLEKHVNRFKKFDDWTRTQSKTYNTEELFVPSSEDDPVAVFEFDDDWDELEIPVVWYPEGKYVLVKFLEPRSDNSGRLGVRGIRFFGFHQSVVFSETNLPVTISNLKQTCLTGEEIQMLVLNFLIDLAQVQLNTKKSNRLEVLEIDEVPVHEIWHVITTYMGVENYDKVSSMIHLLHCLLPVMTSLNDDQKILIDQLFNFLCEILDNPKPGQNKIHKIAWQLIFDGAAVFFPDKESRGGKLLCLMDDVGKLVEKPSIQLVFQSLCQFYTTAEPMSLLSLPNGNLETAENFNSSKSLALLENLISVICHDLCGVVNMKSINEQLVPLHNLFSALQTSLIYWCWQHLNSTSELSKATAKDIVLRYSVTSAQKVNESFQFLLTKDHETLKEVLPRLDKLFPSIPFRQLLILLSNITEVLDPASRCLLLQHFKPILLQLYHMSLELPEFFPNLSHNFWLHSDKDEVVLKEWEVESPHHYENNQHISQSFHCPGASKIVVSFDSRCETESRYDYLQFKDATGESFRFAHKVGLDGWPDVFIFAGPSLHFTFKSDSSNTEWGYKFKVVARGSADTVLTWPYDMLLLLTKLFGQLCGSVLTANPVAAKDPISLFMDDNTEDLWDNALWTTIFRGGYTSPVLQRTLSGSCFTDVNPDVLQLLNDMMDGHPGLGADLLQKCRDHCKPQQIGGIEFDKAITAVFAAILWHSQDLREELESYIDQKDTWKIPDSIYTAFNSAESIRKPLMSQRQKMAVEADKSSRTTSDAENPVTVCQEKARFLLKFAGLSQNEIKGSEVNSAEPLPLVMEFVKSENWTIEKVQSMLKERSEYAHVLVEIYNFIGDFISDMSTNEDILQIPIILFFQELLSYQNHSLHYCESLDGCGLELESKIQESFYNLLLKLINAFQLCKKRELSRVKEAAFNCYQAYLLHLLDINWQVYDLSFIHKIDLPTFLFQVSKDNLITKNCKPDVIEEEAELEEYERHIKMLKKTNKQDFNSFEEKNGPEKKEYEEFISKFSFLLDMQVVCNGCHKKIPDGRYKCLQCSSLDLCTSCISGGCLRTDKESQEHQEDHNIYHLVFHCDACEGYITGTRIWCKDCDYHLCLGCYKTFGNFSSHHKDDHTVKKIPRIISKSIAIETYIQQHSWILYVSLALQLNRMSSREQATNMDNRYYPLAFELHNKCINMVLNDLLYGLDENELSFLGDPRLIDCCDEQLFTSHLQFKIFSLLGMLIQEDGKGMNSFDMYKCISEDTFHEFLKAMFQISSSKIMYDDTTKFMAMGLLGRLLTRSTLQCADKAMLSIEDKVMDQLATGEKAVNFLLMWGGNCFEKGNIEWACSIARTIHKLDSKSHWNDVITKYIHECIKPIVESVISMPKNLPFALFSMFVLAGFPEIPNVGSMIFYSLNGQKEKPGIVLKHYSDKRQTLIADMKNKKWHKINDDAFVYEESTAINVIDTECDFTSLLVNTISQIGKLMEGENVCMELVWIMSLAQKILFRIFKNMNPFFVKEISTAEFVRCLVDFASQGTGLDKQWMLKDLETVFASQKYFIQTAFDDYILKELGQSGKSELATEVPEETPTNDDHSIDTGVQYEEFRGIQEGASSYASEEFDLSHEDMIASPDEVQFDIEQEQKKKSCELLQKANKTRVNDVYLMQLARAMVVLYSRQLLATMLAKWPDDAPLITADLFGIKNGYQVSCIFDLLNGVLPKKIIDEAIQNGTLHCHENILPEVTLMACQFLEEDNVVVITRESKHNYENNTKEEDKIHIPGASYLSVTFDSKCCTEEGCDELEFSTSSDFQNNLHEVSGVAHSNWTPFQVPGDTLYYKFTSDNENSFWGYKFTVTAGFRDRFNTGYLILHNLLFSRVYKHLPMKELWMHLVHVACKQTHKKRLNTILLLLQMIQIQFKNPDASQRIDLSLLCPLWDLYLGLSKNTSNKSGHLPPPVERALTELFLHAEDLAVKWGVSTDYLVALQDSEDIITKVIQGALVVASICFATFSFLDLLYFFFLPTFCYNFPLFLSSPSPSLSFSRCHRPSSFPLFTLLHIFSLLILAIRLLLFSLLSSSSSFLFLHFIRPLLLSSSASLFLFPSTFSPFSTSHPCPPLFFSSCRPLFFSFCSSPPLVILLFFSFLCRLPLFFSSCSSSSLVRLLLSFSLPIVVLPSFTLLVIVFLSFSLLLVLFIFSSCRCLPLFSLSFSSFFFLPFLSSSSSFILSLSSRLSLPL
ncbi:Zinc finger ZZ-type and EF-hand domain-containing protein 1 [Acanthosepion pharaonis]|uniref:Zinc finger ZZ-type and EF-hand domain-containing protein 1 n=1 Tax=Acanthosepion pharaonis TaxID=158019 RepID=A0A812BYY3_ACAPH|nr:Zinc finger ZZ-type and EF-hand domain-containing protein 1 [Sepia pharaonis]